MLRIGMISGLAIATITAALAACGGNVDVVTGGTTSGSGGSAGTGTVSTSSSSSGAGAAGGLPPLACALDEAAIVGVSAGIGQVAVQKDGVWTEKELEVASAVHIATYEDVYGHLGVFWIDPNDGPNDAYFKVTSDGSSFDAYDVHGWAPSESGPLQPIGVYAMLGADEQGQSSIAYFDPDAFDWYPYLVPLPIVASSVVPLQETGNLLAIGLGPANQLCDAQSLGDAWDTLHCRDDVTVATGGEIPVTRPRAVVLPNGDVVVVYSSAAGSALSATTLHAGAWSAPVKVTSDAIGIEFAATATPKGDVIVGVVSTAGVVSALRYSPSAGWSAPIPVDSGALPDVPFGAAPGICGDDALLAYSVGFSQLRVARVRGDAAEAEAVGGELVERYPSQISITTRRHQPL